MPPQRDPVQEMFIQQMQKMSEQMEKENKELLAQLNNTLPQCLDSNFNRPVPWYRGYPPR